MCYHVNLGIEVSNSSIPTQLWEVETGEPLAGLRSSSLFYALVKETKQGGNEALIADIGAVCFRLG